MKKLILLSISALAILATGCEGSHKHNCIEGQDFDTSGLKVTLRCTDCGKEKEVEYELENNQALTSEQTSIRIKYQDYTIDYPITVKKKYKIACVGDSLTAGHMWPNESYPTFLSKDVTANYEVGNFGVNGISITGYGGSFSSTAPNQRYIKQDVYKNCVKFNPDIFAIMLGTNDATEWSKAEPTFVSEYHILLDSFIEQFPNARFIMMVSPPVVDGNEFSIPNGPIRDNVNPVQRDLAKEYGFETLDLREEFEATANFESLYLRPNRDKVHFTKAGAQYVAQRVWDIAKDLRF